MKFEKDMDKLLNIMISLNLNPILPGKDNPNIDKPYGDPTHRIIFCAILSEVYPELLEKGGNMYSKNVKLKGKLKDFLGYDGRGSNNAIKYILREGALETIMGYKDYYERYKLVRAGFNNDSRYSKIKKLNEVRDNAQNEAVKLMNELLNE